MIDERPSVFVVMAVYRPDLDYLEKQVRSILEQRDVALRLVCVLDGPNPAAEATLQGFADSRLKVVPSARLGIVGAFELGLSAALTISDSDADRFAFADQDDVWEHGKLRTLASALDPPRSELAFSDA